jgi:hypothetical protein
VRAVGRAGGLARDRAGTIGQTADGATKTARHWVWVSTQPRDPLAAHVPPLPRHAVPTAPRGPYCATTTAGVVNGQGVLIPIAVLATRPPERVDPASRLYSRMCSTSGQPNLA